MGRKARDLSERCRSSLWAKQVWRDSELSHDRLDMVLLDGLSIEKARSRGSALGTRRRAFHRIYSRGDGIELIQLTDRGEKVHLADWVAEKLPVCRQARDDYFNPIWTLLSAGKAPTEDAVLNALNEGLTRVGLNQLTPFAVAIGQQLCGSTFPVRPGDPEQISQGVRAISGTPSFDAILVLALQCRLAGAAAQYAHAQIFLDALEASTHALGELLEEPYLARQLMDLIDQRLLQNIWRPSKPSEWLHRYLKSKDSTEKDRAEWLDRHAQFGPDALETRAISRADAAVIPMMRLDSKLAWFIENCEALFTGMIAEQAGGTDGITCLHFDEEWQQKLETARHLFGAPKNIKTSFKFVVPGSDSELEDVTHRTKPRRLSRQK